MLSLMFKMHILKKKKLVIQNRKSMEDLSMLNDSEP